MLKCLNCNSELKGHNVKYCSNSCQMELANEKNLKDWLDNKRKGLKGRQVSSYVKNWLLEKANHKCSECGWNKKHPTTSISPLEVDHIDGEWINNRPENLRILCPNCHSLTSTYRNLKRGHISPSRYR